KQSAGSAQANPFQAIVMMAGGVVLPRCLHAAADLGIADALGEEEQKTSEQLAASVGAHPDALFRVLRVLSSNGIFEMTGRKVRHSPASRLLRSDHPHSLRSLARLFGLPGCWNAFNESGYSVRTGIPPATNTHPKGLWRYFQESPEAGRIFNEAMVGEARVRGR